MHAKYEVFIFNSSQILTKVIVVEGKEHHTTNTKFGFFLDVYTILNRIK